MNGFSAADMSTAAANGHAEGYQAGYADAVKAVEPNGKLVGWWNGITPGYDGQGIPSIRWGADAENSGHDIPLYDGYNPIHYQQPTPAAPGIDRELLRDLIDYAESGKVADPSMVERMRTCLDASPKGGESMRDWSLRMATLEEGQHVGAGAHGLQDSPKGGSTDERARFEAWAKTHGLRADRHGDGYYYISTINAWQVWQAALQATSAEVGSVIRPFQIGDRVRVVDAIASYGNYQVGDVGSVEGVSPFSGAARVHFDHFTFKQSVYCYHRELELIEAAGKKPTSHGAGGVLE